MQNFWYLFVDTINALHFAMEIDVTTSYGMSNEFVVNVMNVVTSQFPGVLLTTSQLAEFLS